MPFITVVAAVSAAKHDFTRATGLLRGGPVGASGGRALFCGYRPGRCRGVGRALGVGVTLGAGVGVDVGVAV